MPPAIPKRPPPPRVLVVDDDPLVVELVSRFLSRQGMVVRSALSGRQGLQMVRRRSLDVIVLNVVMPDMDGLAVCAALKKIAAARLLPVILFTAKDDQKTRLEAIRLGVSEFVVKPVSGPELLARLRTHIEASRKARKMERAGRTRRRPKPKT